MHHSYLSKVIVKHLKLPKTNQAAYLCKNPMLHQQTPQEQKAMLAIYSPMIYFWLSVTRHSEDISDK